MATPAAGLAACVPEIADSRGGGGRGKHNLPVLRCLGQFENRSEVSLGQFQESEVMLGQFQEPK